VGGRPLVSGRGVRAHGELGFLGLKYPEEYGGQGGGAGYMREYEIERVVRDTRLGPIGGGTDEVMKEILGEQLGL
jgi:alkylation response protein AidB-like acyl-CoA dehydrogenase